MVCIQCGSDTQVTNSRPQKRLNQVWRRRECITCGTIFTTEESIQYGASWTVRDKKGALQPFNPDRLFLSLYVSLQHRVTAAADARGLADTIIKKLYSLVQDGALDSQSIIQVAQVALNRFDRAASTHYQAYHE